ncbi:MULTISPECIES: SCO0930 family lipoprotein [unclassified Nocardiopsis]|uniref:SCO0930 family lipoprotein n=1 Tax=Nocardiopsis TaxID=2013 RepID=UPI00387AAD1F
MRAKKFSPLAAGVLGLVLLTGCGNAEPYAAAAPAEDLYPVESEEPEEAAPASGAPADALKLSLRGDEALGEIVTDADGFTLYRFENDTAGSGASECYDACAENWPPVTAAEEMTIPGGDDLLGSIEREDGTEQVTLDGWPLYRYAADAAPGDTNGEGAQDVWYAVSPLGTRAADEPWTEGYCPQGFGVRQDPVLGDIVVDDEGFTLYRFEEDSADPPTATCVDDCADIWPPVLAMAEFGFSDGLDASLFDSVAREGRLDQATLNGWALYRYAEDAAPGDTTGHGVNDVWFAVTPTGAIAGDAVTGGGNTGGGGDDSADNGYGNGYGDSDGSGY